MPSPNSEWADLPMELLGHILHLLPFTDHIRLSSVCAPWRSIISRRIFTPRPQSLVSCSGLPILNPSNSIAPPSAEATPSVSLSLRSARASASARDHLTRVQIPLPSLAPLFSYFPHWPLRGYLPAAKAIISFPPSSADDNNNNGFTVVIIHRLSSRLAFFRTGDSSWTAVAEDEDLHDFSDVIYRNGRLHTVDIRGSVYVWDDDFRPAFKENFKPLVWRRRKYLVESSTGELFMVHRKDGLLRTTGIRVMRLDMEAEKCEDVKDLAGSALFVGCNYSMSISALEFPEFSGNCVYFTRDIYNDSHLDRKHRREAGVFGLKKNKFKWLDSSYPEFNRPPSIWFTPTFAV